MGGAEDREYKKRHILGAGCLTLDYVFSVKGIAQLVHLDFGVRARADSCNRTHPNNDAASEMDEKNRAWWPKTMEQRSQELYKAFQPISINPLLLHSHTSSELPNRYQA